MTQQINKQTLMYIGLGISAVGVIVFASTWSDTAKRNDSQPSRLIIGTGMMVGGLWLASKNLVPVDKAHRMQQVSAGFSAGGRR